MSKQQTKPPRRTGQKEQTYTRRKGGSRVITPPAKDQEKGNG